MNSMMQLAGLESTSLTATTTALLRRDELLAKARNRPHVDSPESAAACAAILTDLKGFTRQIEAARVDVKAPVLDVSKQIDALARQLTVALEAEGASISRVLGAYQAEENRKAEESRQRAYEDERRIRQAAADAERAAAQKAAQEAADLAAKAARARSGAGRARAEAEAQLARERADREAQERADRERQMIVENRVTSAATIAPKPAGLSTRAEVCFEVTDIEKLYEAAPFLCTLTPNTAAIKSALKGMAEGKSLPGVKHWIEQKAIVR